MCLLLSKKDFLLTSVHQNILNTFHCHRNLFWTHKLYSQSPLVVRCRRQIAFIFCSSSPNYSHPMCVCVFFGPVMAHGLEHSRRLALSFPARKRMSLPSTHFPPDSKLLARNAIRRQFRCQLVVFGRHPATPAALGDSFGSVCVRNECRIQADIFGWSHFTGNLFIEEFGKLFEFSAVA